MQHMAMFCRKCNKDNPIVYYAPVVQVDGKSASVICLDCVSERGWLDHKTGNLKPGIDLTGYKPGQAPKAVKIGSEL